MRILLRLYPATWRARYEEEFLAVLEERPLSPFDVIDIMLGALDARLRPRSLAIEVAPRRYQPVHQRISGYAAIAGGAVALLMVAIGLLVPEPTSGLLGVILYPVVAIALLVALLGLSAVQGRRLQRSPGPPSSSLPPGSRPRSSASSASRPWAIARSSGT